jgi:NADH:ubiquinone oxidoreductase subunit 6 (subunit J)
MGIFLVSVFTLRKSKMEEKYGRILKLLGGVLMLTLAIVMLVDPTIMNEIGRSLWVFGAAFGVTALVLLVHRVILPKFNITEGSEK